MFYIANKMITNEYNSIFQRARMYLNVSNIQEGEILASVFRRSLYRYMVWTLFIR